jgi:hypothetical protein
MTNDMHHAYKSNHPPSYLIIDMSLPCYERTGGPQQEVAWGVGG